MKVMQSPVDYASNYLKEKVKQDHVQMEKEREDAEFLEMLRVRREKSESEFREERRAESEKFRLGVKPLRPLPELPPMLVKGEPHDSSAPALINPSPALRKEVGVLDIVNDKGVLGIGLAGLLRRRLGILNV